MNISEVCIRRPVLATVISLVLMIFGVLGYQHLATRFFPDFQSRSIHIITQKPGASASYMEQNITEKIEKQLAGISGVDHIESVSKQNNSIITLTLVEGADFDRIFNTIQTHVNLARAQLPSDLTTPPLVSPGYSDMPLLSYAVTNPHWDIHKLQDYISNNVENELSQLPGVANVQVYGADPYAMKIIVNFTELKNRGLSIDQVVAAIRDYAQTSSVGSVHNHTISIPINIKSTLSTVSDFNNIPILKTGNSVIHLKDIANVTLTGFSHASSIVKFNGQRAISVAVSSSTDANELSVAKAVKHYMAEFIRQAPQGMKATVYADMSIFMKNSIHEVYESIGLAIVFVILVIFLFLGNLRSVLIPVVTIPICLVAAMGLMYALDFSINMITLIALVVCIGLVVDDAIVVLENIYRYIQSGMPAVEAAIKGSKEITFAVIVMTLTLVSVYAPFGFMSGMAAAFLTPFAFTLAGVVLLSGFVSLTLSPMMCAKLLRPVRAERRGYAAVSERVFAAFCSQYKRFLTLIMQRRWVIVVATVLLVGLGFSQVASIPKEASPAEDVGFVMVSYNGAMNEGVDYIETQLQQAEALIKHEKNISNYVSVAVPSGSIDGSSVIVLTLKPWGDRAQSAKQIAATLNGLFQQQTGLNVYAFAISGAGSGMKGLQFSLYGQVSNSVLNNQAKQIVEELARNKHFYNIQQNTVFDSQEYNVTIKHQQAAEKQIRSSQITQFLATYFGGLNVLSFDRNGSNYNAYLVSADAGQGDMSEVMRHSLLAADGTTVPLADLVTFKQQVAQSEFTRYNRMPATVITLQRHSGYSVGQAIQYIDAHLPQWLPEGMRYQYLGSAHAAKEANASTGLLFLMALLFIFLILAAQFESFLDPVVILSSVPLCVVVAVILLKWTGGSINLYTSVGLITLIGLIAKHGILITQFANQKQQQGMGVNDAVVQAGGERLRPILMTTVAMCMGVIPLMFADGAGANSRHQIGLVIFSGLLGGTFFSLLVVPVIYSYLNQLRDWCRRLRTRSV